LSEEKMTNRSITTPYMRFISSGEVYSKPDSNKILEKAEEFRFERSWDFEIEPTQLNPAPLFSQMKSIVDLEAPKLVAKKRGRPKKQNFTGEPPKTRSSGK
jgi:hypothetical protein